MRRILLISLVALVLVTVTGAGVAWYLLNDQDFVKEQLGGFALRQTGRELNVDGPLNLSLGRVTTLEARDIRFQNAPWADSADMVSIGHLRLVVDVPSLFGDFPLIPELLLEDCDIQLQQNEANEANWDVLPESPDASDANGEKDRGPPILLLDARLNRCRLSHDAPEREQPLVVAVDELALGLVDEVRWQASGAGRVDEDSFSFDGGMEPAGALLHGQPLDYELQLEVGEIELRSSGSVDDPLTGRGADLDFNFSGPEMATVLERLELPGFSEGAFDFRLSLDSEGQFSELSVDGDLGSLNLNAAGRFDRLRQPQAGMLQMSLSGPDLRSLGEALRVTGLVSEPFEVEADLDFDNGIVEARNLLLKTPNDEVDLSGRLGPPPHFPTSDLNLRASTTDIGRWRTRIGLHGATVGPATLEGVLSSDSNARFSTKAEITYHDAILQIEGDLGTPAGVLEPDVTVTLKVPDASVTGARFGIDRLPAVPATVNGRVGLVRKTVKLQGMQASLGSTRAALDGEIQLAGPDTGGTLAIDLTSPSLAELGALFGQEQLPAAPLNVQGKVSRQDRRLQFEGLNVDLAGHRARVDGQLNTEKDFKGSALDVQLDSPDIGSLAALFGREGIPHEPMNLSIQLRQEGKGLAFRTSDGNVGEITLQVDGHVEDLDEPFGLDANFDIRLPTLALLDFLAPGIALPDLPFSARGSLRNMKTRTTLEDVRFTLGAIAADVSGDLYPDRRFALGLGIGGPDASTLGPWVGRPLPAQPFSASAALEGSPEAFAANDIDLSLGESKAQGSLQIGLGEPMTISGRVQSPYLDLKPFLSGEDSEESEEPASESASKPGFVFGQEPIPRIEDLGLALDLDMNFDAIELRTTQLRDVALGITLNGERLSVSPLSGSGQGGGEVAGNLTLDSSGVDPELRLDLTATDLRLGLAAAEGQAIDTFPTTNAEIKVVGTGATQRDMASSLNGRIRVYSGEGQVAAAGIGLLMGDFLTELFTALNPFAVKSEYTTLECSVTAATIVDGQVKVFPAVYQTRELTILSQGAIDLHTEKLNLSFNTKPRQGIGISAGILINPAIKVGGRLAAPAIELDPVGAAVSGGLAVATAGLSLLAKSTYDRFLSSKDPCSDARAEIAKLDAGERP
jgi:uncharacterized protein involved in outer membrane biogenesis